jgi:hypothetical protein
MINNMGIGFPRSRSIGVFFPIQVFLFVLLSTVFVCGQSDKLETDQGIVASIAPYDAEVRHAILLASEHPETLELLQKIQNESMTSFEHTIQNLSKKKQGWFYTVTRYPNLLHTLATLPKKQSQEEVYKLLPNQDEELKKAAWHLYRGNNKKLIEVDKIQASSQQRFEASIQHLEVPAQEAFQTLLTMPDVLTLLTNNIDLTTRLGQHYRSNPTQVNYQLTELHDSINVQNQYEMAEYKKQMANDPQALAELNQATREYATANGYNIPNQQAYAANNNYYSNPYSYWFGYPSWYITPLWYPASLGFYSGLYFGSGGFGLYGFPSYGFSYWFFNGRNYNRYPHLYHQFGNYYHGNMAGHRVVGSANHGFMAAANTHYNATRGGGLNRGISAANFHGQGGNMYRPNAGSAASHFNANAYHAQSWGSYGGRGNFAGGGGMGGMHSSGGFGGGRGGGFGGGGRGHR